MQPDLAELRITLAQLEKITGLDISTVSVQGVIRPTVWRSRSQVLSVLATQGLILGVLFILCLGVALVLAQSYALNAGMRWLFLVALGVAVAIAMGWQGWLQWQGRELQTLLNLLPEVDRHNEVVEAVHVMDELVQVQAVPSTWPQRDAILTALRATRESLVCGLMTERILRKHQRFMARRQELFTHIETNLATLQQLQIHPQAQEYQQLLQEALDIGLAVQRELQADQSHR